jgi:hypothetical protein
MSLLVDRIAEPAVVRDAPFPLLIATDVLDRDIEARIGPGLPAISRGRILSLRAGRLRPRDERPRHRTHVPDVRRSRRRSAVHRSIVAIPGAGDDLPRAQPAPRHHPHRQQVEGRQRPCVPQSGWAASHAGCLRFLSSGNDIEALVAPEIEPVYGTLTAFRRTDNSFHGHLPYEGERRVIQVAWLTDAAAVGRKTRRGRFSRAIKWLSGRVDRWFGKDRDKDAAHLD